MLVKDLIEELKKFHEDMEVVISLNGEWIVYDSLDISKGQYFTAICDYGDGIGMKSNECIIIKNRLKDTWERKKERKEND